MLVVPEKVSSLSLRHVAIAWKDAREARRAVLDALPFLQPGFARQSNLEVPW